MDDLDHDNGALLGNGVSDELNPVSDDNADGAIAVDALLDAIPSSDGDPSGIDALSHRLAELNSVLAVSDDEIEEDVDQDVDLASDSPPHLEVETPNYDIGGDQSRRSRPDVPARDRPRAAPERGTRSRARIGDGARRVPEGQAAQLTSDFGEPPEAGRAGPGDLSLVPAGLAARAGDVRGRARRRAAARQVADAEAGPADDPAAGRGGDRSLPLARAGRETSSKSRCAFAVSSGSCCRSRSRT